MIVVNLLRLDEHLRHLLLRLRVGLVSSKVFVMHIFVYQVGIWIRWLTFRNFQVVCELFVTKFARKDRLKAHERGKFPCLSLKEDFSDPEEGLTVKRWARLRIDRSISSMESLRGGELFKHAHESKVVFEVAQVLDIEYRVLEEVLR